MKDNVKNIRVRAKAIGKAYEKIINNISYDNVIEENNLKYSRYDSNILDVYKPNKAKKSIILYIHGGGWISLDKNLYKPILLFLANNGYMVFNINYRLAPEHTVDDMEEDILNAISYAINYSKRDKVYLMGDSAGAHLASLVTNKLLLDKYKDNHLKKYIIGNLLFYGVFDLTNVRDTHFHDIDTYLSSIVKKDEDKIKYSPVTYINKNIPRVFISSGEVDKLNVESKEYYNLLKKYDIEVEALIFPKTTLSAHHSFLNYYTSYACRESMKALLNFLNKE